MRSLQRRFARSPLLALGGVWLAIAGAAHAQAAPGVAATSGAASPSPDASAPPPGPERARGVTPAGQGANGRGESQSLEEITITARKRNERLIDVPVSANALSGAALEKYAITDLTSAGVQVPQVRIDHAASGNGAIITIRGVGSASVDASIEQEVTVNIDGVPVSRGRVIQQAFFDQQAVEILKGPQALYFGKNSPAGVISITSTNPAKEFEGYVRGGYETTTQEYFGEFAVSLPINDKLGARIAFRGSDMQGGYTRGIAPKVTDPAVLPAYLAATGDSLPGSPFKDYPGDKEEVLRLTLDYKPTEKFDALLKFLVSNHEDRGDSMAGRIFSCGPLVNHPASVDILTGKLLIDPYGPCNINARTNSYGTIPASVAQTYRGSNGGTPYTQVVTYLGSLTLNYHPTDQLTLTSVTGLNKYREIQFSNYDETVFAAATGQNNDYNTSVSEELRLSSSFAGPLNFTAGLFYEHDDREFYQEGSIGYLPPDPTTGKRSLFGSTDYFQTSTYSGFAELNYKLPYNLEIAGGARYTVEDKAGVQQTTYLSAFLTGAASPPGVPIPNRFTEHNVSPQVTLSWKPMHNVLIYGAYKEGFKSGGISAPAIIPALAVKNPGTQRFDQETVSGGEIGAKISNMFGHLTGDLSLYDYTYSGLQLTAFDATTTSYFTQNAASASVRGIELNLNYKLSREFSVHGSVGYNHARYVSFPGSQCWAGQPTPSTPASDPFYAAAHGQLCVNGVQDLSGKPLSRAPAWSNILGATYEHALFGNWTLGMTADFRYSSGYYIETNNNPYGYQGGYYLIDLSARVYNDKWEVSVIGRNVGDVDYAVLGGDKPLGPGGQVLSSVGTPREVLLQLTRRF